MAINSVERDGRNACQQTGFASRAASGARNGRHSTPNIPKGEATGNMEVRPELHVAQIEHDASGKVTGVTYFDAEGKLQRQKARVVAVAGNSLESPRSSAEFRLVEVSGRARQLLGPGRAQLHAAHHRVGLRHL